jgi:hypothetical protein
MPEFATIAGRLGLRMKTPGGVASSGGGVSITRTRAGAGHEMAAGAGKAGGAGSDVVGCAGSGAAARGFAGAVRLGSAAVGSGGGVLPVSPVKLGRGTRGLSAGRRTLVGSISASGSGRGGAISCRGALGRIVGRLPCAARGSGGGTAR